MRTIFTVLSRGPWSVPAGTTTNPQSQRDPQEEVELEREIREKEKVLSEKKNLISHIFSMEFSLHSYQTNSNRLIE